MKPVVLVHGSYHGPWCWERVTPLLDAAGVPWVAPDLPSVARSAEGAGVLEDVAEVKAVLGALPGAERAVLVGHSSGGRVISEAGTHERVGNLVYLAGTVGADAEANAPRGARDVHGALIPDPVGAAGRWYNDCGPAEVEWALARLRPVTPIVAWAQSRQAWRQRRTTYVVCTLDLAMAPEQRRAMAPVGADVLEWETGHSPFLARPDLVAELLIRLAT